MRHLASIIGIGLFSTLFFMSPAIAAEANLLDTKELVTKAGSAIGIFLLLAILIENALAVLFNWRLFLTYFSLRGVRTPILVAVSALVVEGFDLDVIADLLNKIAPERGGDLKGDFFTATLTTLTLAGGGSGVHNLMRAMGLRRDAKEKQLAPVPPKDVAWIAVRVRREQSVGLVHVLAEKIKGKPGKPRPSAIAGTIQAKRPSPMEILRRNINRFPENGGYAVEPDALYMVSVAWSDVNGDLHTKRLSDDGFVFAPRAIVDFDITL